MAFRYTIPEISAITLLSAIEEKDGNGWFHRHVKNIIKFVRKYPDLVSKPNQKNAEKLVQGFSTA